MMEWSVATVSRLIAVALQIAAAIAVIKIARPKRGEVKAAFLAGAVCGAYDWTIEAIAYKKGLWFCYGGIQKIALGDMTIDFMHVPIDMVIGFVFYGVIISFVSIYREIADRYERLAGRLHPGYDAVRLAAVLILFSFGGATVDFASKKLGIWQNGPTWSYLDTALVAWLPLNALTVFTFRAARLLLRR